MATAQPSTPIDRSRRPIATCRPPSSTSTPSATARARSPRTARSSSGPASTPGARRRTSSSCASLSSVDKVWWGEINQPLAEEHYDRLRDRLMQLHRRPADLQPGPVHRGRSRSIGARCASTPRRRGPASSPATCSGGRRSPSSRASRRTSRSSTSPRSRPIPRPRASAPRPRSCSTSIGWRSSSSGPSTPERSRSRRSR